ncbi:gp436 family protein [Shewanella frigidimarina]|jgi:phage gp36-like protein|uniref:gp436 family protein n=1 Tax=Shewanella frigidimarina TaxID=56812 RepID=UPI003D7C047B
MAQVMYANTDNMLSRFGEQDLMLLTEREGSVPGQINIAVLEQALRDASAEIDGYIVGRYTLPLTTVPAVLERNCCDIARYFLYGDKAPEQVEKRYNAVVKYLALVSKGDISLGLADTGEVASQSELVVSIDSAGTVFGRKSSKGFI